MRVHTLPCRFLTVVMLILGCAPRGSTDSRFRIHNTWHIGIARLVKVVSRSRLAAQHWATGKTLALLAPAGWGAIEHVVV